VDIVEWKPYKHNLAWDIIVSFVVFIRDLLN